MSWDDHLRTNGGTIMMRGLERLETNSRSERILNVMRSEIRLILILKEATNIDKLPLATATYAPKEKSDNSIEERIPTANLVTDAQFSIVPQESPGYEDCINPVLMAIGDD